MKRLLTALTFLALTNQAIAKDQPMVDVPSDDQIVDSVQFSGKPGFTTTASIVKVDEETAPALMITHNKPGDVRNYIAIYNENLGLLDNDIDGMGSRLQTTRNGMLEVVSSNEAIGREAWIRTLRVAYINSKYMVVSYDYTSYDRITGESIDCEYNLLTGQGTLNANPVKVETKPLDLETLVDSEKLYGCSGIK